MSNTDERAALEPCPFCGDDGDKGLQEVTQMNAERTKFVRITCRSCGAMCPSENWNRRAAPAAPVKRWAMCPELEEPCSTCPTLNIACEAASPSPQPAAIERLTEEEIEQLAREDAGGSNIDWTDGWNLFSTAPQRAAFRRGCRAAIERELSRVPDGASCPHEAEPRGCYRVRCQLGRKCVEAAAPTPGSPS